MRKEEIITMSACAAIGSMQTFVLREYVDRNRAPLIPQFGQWGTASCVLGIGAGLAATIAGIAGAVYGVGLKDRKLQLAAVSYGIPAVVSGVASGYFQPPVRIVNLPAPPRSTASGVSAPAAIMESAPRRKPSALIERPALNPIDRPALNPIDPRANLL